MNERTITHEHTAPDQKEAIVMDENLTEWRNRMNELMQNGARIIALRGAGTVNGIEPGAATHATEMLKSYIDDITDQGTDVALIYDGDGDDRDNPDIGSVFGGLTDTLKDNPRVTTMAAQTQGWYSPAVDGDPIASATGNQYETYVFPDDLPGSHASVTQSQELVSYDNYEQVFVGPAGPIALSQLQDLQQKSVNRPEGSEPLKVTVIEAHNNPNLAAKLNAQLDTAQTDPEQRSKIEAKIAQRQEHPYGALFTKDGNFAIAPNDYPGLSFAVMPAAELAPKPIVPKNLEALRWGMRGNDKAVQEIGTEADQQRLTEILKNPENHTRDELLDAIIANYSGEAYGDNQWVKKYNAWGDAPEIITLYGRLMESHPEFAQLSIDPGFMTHLPEFVQMLDEGEITTSDCAEARKQLKDKLGTKTVYRGTMLTDDEYAAVQAQGIGSPLSRTVKDSEQPNNQFEATALSTRPSHAIELHFHGEHRSTPFLSVSEYPDVAIAIGRHFGDRTPGKKFYLFELQVPVIDTIQYTDHAFKTPDQLRERQDRNPNFAIKVGVNGQESAHKWDGSVESFVFWKIDASEIAAVTQPDITESTWNGRTTKNLGSNQT